MTPHPTVERLFVPPRLARIRMRTLVPAVGVLMLVSAGCGQRPVNVQERNKAIVLRSEEDVWSKRNLAVADEL